MEKWTEANILVVEDLDEDFTLLSKKYEQSKYVDFNLVRFEFEKKDTTTQNDLSNFASLAHRIITKLYLGHEQTRFQGLILDRHLFQSLPDKFILEKILDTRFTVIVHTSKFAQEADTDDGVERKALYYQKDDGDPNNPEKGGFRDIVMDLIHLGAWDVLSKDSNIDPPMRIVNSMEAAIVAKNMHQISSKQHWDILDIGDQEKIADKHNGQWVALVGGVVKASAPSLHELLNMYEIAKAQNQYHPASYPPITVNPQMFEEEEMIGIPAYIHSF